jgi:hypothetical protein
MYILYTHILDNMSDIDLSSLFKEYAGAYFIKKAKEKYPSLKPKDIEAWLKDQEVVQINKRPMKALDLKITAPPQTFQIDIMYVKIGTSQKAFLLLVDIMSRKAFCYFISGDPNGTKIVNAYEKFLERVDKIHAVEGDDEFNSKAFRDINEAKNIRLDTSVANDNHFAAGNKLGIIDRLVRTLKENISKYRDSVDDRGNYQNMMDNVIGMYNDSPHRALKGKTPNEVWGDLKGQKARNMKESMLNDMIFSKIDFTSGEPVRVLKGKGRFDKGNAQFSKEIYEIHSSEGYTFTVMDSGGELKPRRYKAIELQPAGNVQNVIDRARIQRDEAADKKYKTTNKLIRNEEMTRTEARKAVKAAESDALGPARNTRSQARTTRSQAKK